MLSLWRRILSTLAYHSIFDYPLTLDEIHRYLISDSVVLLPTLKKEIDNLLKTGKIIVTNGFFLPSSLFPLPSSLISLRQHRKDINLKKLIIAKQASRIISMIPWVKMVAVTGALAMENTDENDDIDLMIVTSQNCLWIVRPLAILLISLFFKRRKPSNHPTYSNHFNHSDHFSYKNHICLNLWLDESTLEIPVSQRNLYTSHELAQMKPVVNKDGIYERMMWENRWGKKYLANVWKRFEGWKVNRLKRSSHFQTFDLFSLLNLLSFRLQLWYMKPKMTNERVSLRSAFFHPGNRTDTILSKYDRLCHRNI